MVKKVMKYLNCFSIIDISIWCCSALAIIASFLIFDKESYITLFASLTGITSLIFCAKGNPFGQFLMVIFSVLYGIISFSFSYYGEMITYVGMTMPMAVFSLISWLKNPNDKNSSEVKVNILKKSEYVFMLFLAAIITLIFYFILTYFNTANIIPSTISVATSFIAVYLTFRRSKFFTLAYALNDIVLVVLWVSASFSNTKYISVVVCFAAFLISDLYGFICWRKMEKRQAQEINTQK